MKKITEFSVNYPITIMMLVMAIILLGYISFDKLGMDLFPDLNNPRIFIELKAGERPPEEIEQQFVENIESMAMRQKNVVEVSSISRVGSAQITVEYSWDADMDEAFLDLQKSITDFGQSRDIEEITLSQHDPNTTPIVIIGFSHPQITDMNDLRKIAVNYIRNELIRLEGIAAVEIIGAEEKEVVIQLNPLEMASYNLSVSNIANQINSSNLNISGGSIVEMGLKYIIKSVGEFHNLDDIKNVIVAQTYSEGTDLNQSQKPVPVYLKDIAYVHFKNKDPENIVRINQKRCVALAIYKETKFNTVKAYQELKQNLDEIQKALPGYEFVNFQNQAEFIEDAINEVEETALIGILLAVIILYVFLRRIGTTAIISIAIPVSVIATFNLMYFNGLTLNIMTLGGLALGAGMLVDNAIVVMENIFRNLESGLSLKDASIQGTAQVGGAITASTITTIVVFLPIVYLHGAAGELFKEQAWTVAFSLLSSLVIAILVIPMLSSRFLKSDSKQVDSKSIRFTWYKDFLRKVLQRRWLVLIFATSLVFVTLLIIPFIGSEFIPRTETNSFQMKIKLEEGSTLEHTAKVVEGIENIVKQLIGQDLLTVYTQAGPSTGLSDDDESFFEDENTASIDIFLKTERNRSIDQIIKVLNEVLKPDEDLEIEFTKEQSALRSILGTEQAPIIVETSGEDLEIIQSLTNQAVDLLNPLDEILNLETSFDEGRPEWNIVVDRERAGRYNLSMESISSQLKDQLDVRSGGDWDYEGEIHDITLKLPEPKLMQLSDLVVASGEQYYTVNDIATIEKSIGQKEINRRNQERIGRIYVQLKGEKALDHVVDDIHNEMSKIDFPPNYNYKIAGEEQKRADSFENLEFALLLSIILIYMVLASQFESLIHPFTIILTIPLAAVGSIFIFLLLGKPLNIMAYIGIIMLVGIAVNDSIILVDAINQLRMKGYNLIDAVLEAGQRRIRPIVMTSLTTILALLPLTIGFGESASLRSPMALAVIGGLITSTLLTLIVIPCVYFTLDQIPLFNRGRQDG